MSHELEQLRDAALAESAAATDEQTLETTRVRYLGRAGSISAWADRMKSLGKEERPIVGKLLNEARNAVTAAIQQLEAIVCARLLERTPTGVTVTMEGSRFLSQGRQILASVAEAVRGTQAAIRRRESG